MPTQDIESVFFVGALTWEQALNGSPTGMGTSTANLDTSPTSTEQLLSETFTVGPTPDQSPDGLWDRVTFSVTIVHENPTLSATEEDHGTVVFHLYNSAGSPTAISRVKIEVAPETAPAGTTTVSHTISFLDVPPGTYRLFAGELDTGDGQALRVEVVDGTSVEVVCFAADTLIMTGRGNIPVQDLSVGDAVCTRDNGLQKIRWISTRCYCRKTLEQSEKLRPVRIAAGALGEGIPERDLLVSQQHRVIVRSRIANRMFRLPEILCAAKHLVGSPGISIAQDTGEVCYTHFMLDRHEIVFSNGTETESMFPGKQALRSLTAEQREEIGTIFPELLGPMVPPPFCRHVISGREGRKLAERHMRNDKPIVDGTPATAVE